MIILSSHRECCHCSGWNLVFISAAREVCPTSRGSEESELQRSENFCMSLMASKRNVLFYMNVQNCSHPDVLEALQVQYDVWDTPWQKPNKLSE